MNKKETTKKTVSSLYETLESNSIQDSHSFEISAHIKHTERKSNENLSLSPHKREKSEEITLEQDTGNLRCKSAQSRTSSSNLVSLQVTVCF
jgi:hypothetical protein